MTKFPFTPVVGVFILEGKKVLEGPRFGQEVAYGSFASEPVNAEDPFAVVNSSHVIGCRASIREPKES